MGASIGYSGWPNHTCSRGRFCEAASTGALLGNRNRLSPKIYALVRPEFDCITEGLGRLLEQTLAGRLGFSAHVRTASAGGGIGSYGAARQECPDDGSTSALVREIVRKRKYS